MNVTALETKMSFMVKRLSSLKQEYADMREAFELASKEISGLYLKAHPDKKEKPTEERPDIIEEEQIQDPELKKIFKKISLKAHPDKLLSLNNPEEAEEKKELFALARQALADNDIFSMMNIAEKLNIQTPPVTETQVKKAEEEIKDIKNKIDEIESTAVWHWFLCTNSAEKDQMLKKIFGLMHAYYTGP